MVRRPSCQAHLGAGVSGGWWAAGAGASPLDFLCVGHSFRPGILCKPGACTDSAAQPCATHRCRQLHRAGLRPAVQGVQHSAGRALHLGHQASWVCPFLFSSCALNACPLAHGPRGWPATLPACPPSLPQRSTCWPLAPSNAAAATRCMPRGRSRWSWRLRAPRSSGEGSGTSSTTCASAR